MSLFRISTVLVVAAYGCSDPSNSDTAPDSGPPNEEIQWRQGEFAEVELADIPVPIDHEDPNSGTQAHVEVFRLASLSASVDPIVFLTGGPGGDVGSLVTAFTVNGALQGLRENHDIYLVNARGTRVGVDSVCEDLKDGWEEEDDAASQLKACLVTNQHYLNNIGTQTLVLDLEYVRAALNLESWSVYGVSYGTMVGAAYAKLFPGRIDSLVLDGVLDPTADPIGESASTALESLRLLANDCGEQPECPDAFSSDPIGLIRSLLAKANAGWIVETVDADFELVEIDMTRKLLFSVVSNSLVSTESRMSLPYLLDDANAGDDEPLSYALDLEPTGARESLIHVVVACRELWRDNLVIDPPQGENDLFGDFFTEPYDKLCPIVIDNFGPKAVPHPDSSSVKTLLLSGEGDDRTPPSYGDTVHQRFKNSQHVVLKGRSHGVANSECGAALTMAFLDSPQETLDTSCADIAPPWPSEDEEL